MNDQLTLTGDEMRTLGYRVVDMLVDHFANLPSKAAAREGSRQEMEALLNEPMPEEGRDALEVLGRVERDVFSYMSHTTHPRFFAFIPSPSNFVSVMADALASGFNPFGGTWLAASGPAQIELLTVDWLREAIGLPDEAGGLFVSGGSMANLIALAVAREVKLKNRQQDAVIYYSDQTHSSIERGLRLLGFGTHQLREVGSDAKFRLDLGALEKVVAADRAAGLQPFCVVANAGTTNTGAIDPLPQLADYCQQEGLWLHADGAYGAAAVFSEQGKARLAGLERVDSLSLDPHKWLFQPYEIACLLVREARWLKQTFHILPEYLADTEEQGDEVNFCDLGPQLTRQFRALKLWMSLQTFGRAAFAAAVERGFELAEIAQEMIQPLADWELVTPAQMGIVTFRYAPKELAPTELNRLNRALVTAMIEDGFAFLSSTVLSEKVVLRMCTINPRTTDLEVKETLAWLDKLGQRLRNGGEEKDAERSREEREARESREEREERELRSRTGISG